MGGRLKIADRPHENGVLIFHIERCGSILILKLSILFDSFRLIFINFLLWFLLMSP